ncbi:MAG: bifunctional phosphoserine phosphatase/homoserine phosphotransferase ThrH [Ilumatobacteraceae bacterium]
MSDRQWIVTLDLEGVLVPEIWIAVAERTGVEALSRTTRDEPDYDVLMRDRIRLLDEHGLTMSVISEVISGLTPLEGAADFLERLRSIHQVIILSDTFEQFAGPLMTQLAYPTIMCHRLVVQDDRVTDYQLRQQDQKRRAVEAFRSIGFSIVAAGDSYNDLSMLRAADHGMLFRAPERVRIDNADLNALVEYDDLLDAIIGLTG